MARTEPLDNPYLYEFRALYPREVEKLGFWDRFQWGIKQYGTPEAFQAKYEPPQQLLRAKYAWAVPTFEAVRAIADWSPLVEIGAGTGYWAWLLRQLGADVVAYDLHPPGPEDAHGHNTFHGPNPCFTEVLPGGPEMAAQHPDRTLFLCWPPKDDTATRALMDFPGRQVIHVGAQGVTADAQFHAMLATAGVLERVVELPNWWIEKPDRVEFWRRKV